MKGMNIQPVGVRRLVLGFDAGCMTCSGLASSIEEAVGDRLEVRSLSEPPMEHWRREVFGENASWAPTLVEVSGSNVQAWTGWRMAAHMAHILGTTTTWRVMQVLGELDAVPVPEIGITAKLAGRLSRAGFLKGVGGVLIAASILTGTEALAKGTPLKGWTHPLERVRFRSQERLQGASRREALRSAAASSDVRNIWKGRNQRRMDAAAPPKSMAPRISERLAEVADRYGMEHLEAAAYERLGALPI